MVNIPNPIFRRNDVEGSVKGNNPEVQADETSATTTQGSQEHLIIVDRYSQFTFTVKVCCCVLIFIDKLKRKMLEKKGLQVENNIDEHYY